MHTEAHPDVVPILRELDDHRARFIDFCHSLEREELDRPVPGSEWIVRDFIAHLATIDRTVLRMFEGIRQRQGADASSASSGGGGGFDIDRWNNAQAAKRRDTPVEAVLEEAAANRVDMRSMLGSLSAGDLDAKFSFGGDNKRAPAETTLVEYLRGWCKHDPMHVADMLRALPDRRTPHIEEWLDDPVIRRYQESMNASTKEV